MLVECTEELCKTCKYSTEMHGCRNIVTACYYMGITRQSRLYKNGKKQHDPNYCDKYVMGERPEIFKFNGRLTRKEWKSEQT